MKLYLFIWEIRGFNNVAECMQNEVIMRINSISFDFAKRLVGWKMAVWTAKQNEFESDNGKGNRKRRFVLLQWSNKSQTS